MRLNLSLDKQLLTEIETIAKAEKVPIAAAARALLGEALQLRRRRALRALMAAAYAAGAKDEEALEVLRAMQGGQDEILRRDGK
jgi:metal-responsive CopG/Arc/MetJ family transcriptional regulator